MRPNIVAIYRGGAAERPAVGPTLVFTTRYFLLFDTCYNWHSTKSYYENRDIMTTKQRTIIDAIKEVMHEIQRPLTVAETYQAIVKAGLYNFKAENPEHVVRSQIRRHTQGIDIPSGSDTKHFEISPDGKYALLAKPITQAAQKLSPLPSTTKKLVSDDLKSLHSRFVDDFKQRLLEEIKRIDPSAFEQFCKNLLSAYGFRDLQVTRYSKDNGIDGYGKLKVGFAYFNVAFQCKRWIRNTIGRTDIDQFRGAIQGKYEQGMFFTTGRFSADAKKSSFQPGAVTIILIDGATIVDFMIESGFGIEVETLPIYSFALDNALS